LIQSITVTKTNDTYREILVFKSGATQEKWIYEGMELMKASGTNVVVPIPPPTTETPNPDWADYSHSDFKRVEWVSPDYYKGAKNFEGKPAYSFEKGGSGEKKLIAYLSADTQLPLFCSDWETTRIYTYNPAPSEPLVLPPDFLNTMQTFKKGIQSLTRHTNPQ
jgi:hypothetical protein